MATAGQLKPGQRIDCDGIRGHPCHVDREHTTPKPAELRAGPGIEAGEIFPEQGPMNLEHASFICHQPLDRCQARNSSHPPMIFGARNGQPR